MTGLVRKATLFAVVGALAAAVAMANVPDPNQSLCPTDQINIIGFFNDLDGTPALDPTADPYGAFCVTVIGLNSLPIEGSLVVIDLSNCNLQLCVSQYDDGEVGDPAGDGLPIVDCATQTIRRYTDALGVACFRIQGKSRPDLGCLVGVASCVSITADGVPLLCNPDAPTFDLVQAGGVDTADLAEMLQILFFCTVDPIFAHPHRVDYYPLKGEVDTSDLARFLDVQFGLLTGTPNSPQNCDLPKDNVNGPKCE